MSDKIGLGQSLAALEKEFDLCCSLIDNLWLGAASSYGK
jgi:hypothetical protein